MVNGSYFLVYRNFISPAVFRIFAESTNMVLSTSVDNINYLFLIIVLLLTLLTANWLWQFKPTRKWLFIPNALLFVSTFIFLLLHWYSVAFFQNSDVAFFTNLSEHLLFSKKNEFYANRVKLSSIQTTNKPGQNIIFVIGESQVASHMSLYGYSRKTTEKLDSLYEKGEIIPFRKAVAIGNKTLYSVPYMLVGLQGPDPNGVFYNMPSVFDYAKKAGYYTMFISAQDLHWGHLDKLFNDGSIDLLADGNHF